ncbi:MAG: cobalamin biosynthesis protein [Thermoactinomyces sp.]
MSRTIAVIAMTKHGVEMARRLVRELPGSDLYYPDKFARQDEEKQGITLFSGAVRSLLPSLFQRYDGLILFLSLGVVVRLIAPLLKDKKTDPAVVVIDERGEHAISVLSGHLGGANQLTRRVASMLDARPVITTASDVQETIPVDLFGSQFGWELEDFERVTPVSAAVVNEERVLIIQESGETGWWTRDRPLPDHIQVVSSTREAREREFDAALVVTHRCLSPEEAGRFLQNGVLYRPKVLVIGIGCNRGTALEELEQVVTETFAELNLSIKSVRNLATIDLKKDEPGLVALSQKYDWRVDAYSPAELNTVPLSNPSPTVYRYTGAYGVSEPAALLSSGAKKLLLPKKKSGNVTISVALVPHSPLKGVREYE